MAAPGRPQFFCTRPDGSLTPLVAVDELPTNVTIHGAPRIITAGETQGMTSCGLAAQRPEPWSVEGLPKSSEGLPDMHSLLLQLITDKNVPEDMQASAKAILFKGIDNGRVGQGTPSNGLSPMAPTFQTKNNHVGNKHAPTSKKEYCSYWIRHGCLYKHEMPNEQELIEKLGLRDIPRWYREKFNQPPMRALPSSASPTDEINADKASNVCETPKLSKSAEFTKSPPRGPSNRGGHNGFGNRGGRNGAPNGHHVSNWKGSHRGGRNRNMGSTRHGMMSERDSDRSGECSPRASAIARYDTQAFGRDQVRTPIPALRSMITIDTDQRPNECLLDDDTFEDALNKPIEPNHRVQSSHVYQHDSNTSSDGGVMFPKNHAAWDSNFGSFAHVDIPARKQSESNSSRATVQRDYGSSTPRIGDLQLNDNVPLSSNDTRVTWGPIGGPILKRTSPPLENISHMFGPYSNSLRRSN
ncbi:hypothetical protein DTO006G1_1960 [Penicillium roqueforti]|uniref:uncharacterized protein n=1 Tax=Penicillium roqueforti TaxID=5082 RepID=UPI00190BFDB4|nr:uncharacterized protein LCP9604111_7577 [Penicillium roqueforti]KAF9243658.1 hypothetical protein LCP9604111_7577 [Penicillium roqueforti]KAI1832346.1 hypothetical protein CBS147337_7026 [Penicillium roqueforti]KAI2699062.1 hypothetical protein CBS147372_6309 [Penicillium roqueforti]KAI2713025.1 hypothetical protein CBS147354_7836 [Penicillium roqueforti]KAI2716889.1 hypothetical protein CBS147318_5016 [Penicillium roqueforti]